MDKGEQLAWVWRSKARCNPLFIATGIGSAWTARWRGYNAA